MAADPFQLQPTPDCNGLDSPFHQLQILHHRSVNSPRRCKQVSTTGYLVLSEHFPILGACLFFASDRKMARWDSVIFLLKAAACSSSAAFFCRLTSALSRTPSYASETSRQSTSKRLHAAVPEAKLPQQISMLTMMMSVELSLMFDARVSTRIASGKKQPRQLGDRIELAGTLDFVK